jgi:ABC-type Fe3+-siderophore transport system permease subunit
MSVTRLAVLLPMEHWWRALAMPTADVPGLVFADVALPRIAVSLIVGAALALAGVLLQQALRNPLADTTTLGVASGSYLALAATTLFAPAWLDAGQTWIALAGGGVAAALILAISRAAGFAPAVLILAGLTVSLVSGAAGAALTILNHDYLSTLFIWQAGSLVQNGWSNILDVLPRLALCAIAAALLLRPLAAFDLEDGQAQALGSPVGMLRGAAAVLAVALGAFSVSTVGVIGFVGVAAGNLVRALGARTLLQRLVWAPLTGALLLWSTDELVQRLTPILGAIPTGSVAAVLGAPLLVLMIARQRNAAPPPIGTSVQPIGRTRYPRTVISVILLACLFMMSIALFFGKDATGWRWLAMDGASAVLPWRHGGALLRRDHRLAFRPAHRPRDTSGYRQAGSVEDDLRRLDGCHCPSRDRRAGQHRPINDYVGARSLHGSATLTGYSAPSLANVEIAGMKAGIVGQDDEPHVPKPMLMPSGPNSRLRLPICHLKNVSPELLESALAAREDDDLLVSGLPVERVEHLFDAVVVRIDERIVKDHRRRPPVAGEQPCKGQTRQHRELLAHASAQAIHILFLAVAQDRLRQERLVVEGDRDIVEQQAEQRLQLGHHGLEIELAGFRASSLQRRSQPLRESHLLLERGNAGRRRGECLGGLAPFLFHGLIGPRTNFRAQAGNGLTE